MVPVGAVVFEGRGVTVEGVEARGRQALKANVIARRSTATTTPPRLVGRLAPMGSRPERGAGEQSPLKRLIPVGKFLPFIWRLPRRQHAVARNDIGRESLIK
jgi:hypothetical protein